MGARESRSQPDNDDHDDDATPQDYYAILEVEENASADEIRVSLSANYFLARKKRERAPQMTIFWLLKSDSPFIHHDSVLSDDSRSSIIRTRIVMI
jgi:hypothetical protein